MSSTVDIYDLNRTFGAGKALDGVHLRVNRGEMVALIGASGSGKSTLLRHIAGLTVGDRDVDSGRIEVQGRLIQSGGRLARDVRQSRTRIGFIFQQFNLVGRLTVLQNVLVGLLGRIPEWRGSTGRFTRKERELALAALRRVGLADRALQRASTLSGGQQQRVAIARAMAQQAELILADEPIASLDPESSRRVMESLSTLNREDRRTVIVSLHQVDFAVRYCPRTVALKDGRIHFDGPTRELSAGYLRELYGARDAMELGLDSLRDSPVGGPGAGGERERAACAATA